jgi:hypothetical protein
MTTKKRRTTVPNHLKPQRGLPSEVLGQRRRQKNALRREQERFEKSKKESAIQRMREVSARNTKEYAKTNWGQAIINSVADGQRAVLRSWGMGASVYASVDHWNTVLSAYTDFNNIFVKYPVKTLPDDSDHDASRKFAIEIRGILQHEIGHLRFTLPYNDLRKRVDEMSRTLLDGHAKSHYAWNILEDQRMETLVVQAVPRIASYFESMVAKHILYPVTRSLLHSKHVVSNDAEILNTWILVSNRSYIKPELRRLARQAFIERGYDADRWYDIVESYKTADNIDDMVKAVVDAATFLESLGESLESPKPTSRHESSRTKSTSSTQPVPCDKENNEFADGQDGEEQDGEEQGEGSGQGSDDKSHEEQSDDTLPPEPTTKDKATYSPDSPADNIREMLDEIISDNLKEQYNHSETTEAIANAHERIAQVGGGMAEAPQTGKPMSAEQEAEALRISVGMEQALNDFVTASQPAWINRQEVGIIDPLAYRTKDIGDLDYRRRLEGDYNTGVDLHLSMLCDVSGSMGGKEIEQLSIAMYATAVACKRIGIGTTFLLWSTEGNEGRVWVNGEPSPTVWYADGGTNPVRALNDLEFHNPEEASNHLVLVFTDGAWDVGDSPLSNWSEPGRHIVLSRLVEHIYDHEDYRFKADAYASVNDVSQLPEKLTSAIHSVLSS